MTTTITDAPALRGLQGRVIAPGDGDYDAARSVFYGGVDRRPAAIVRVANAQDVARVTAYARDSGLELAVRSGGHSLAGYSVCEGGIVIDLHDMKALAIDAERRTAWAETGLTAVEYSAAANAHGLATGFGDTGSVGIGGITLGGGVGYLARKYGLTVDSLIGAEIVTADGAIRTVDAENEPELFWAVRGGGGNFGVATRFHYVLNPVGIVVGGMLIQPATAELIASFMSIADAAPEELTTIANVMPAPPMPFVPAEHHGKLVVMSLIVHTGAPADAERDLAKLRALATPIVDMLRPMPYPEIYPPEDPSYHPIGPARNMFVDKIDRASAAAIVEHLATSTASFSVAQLRVLGGAVARVPDDATAYAHRKRRIMVNLAALVDRAEEVAQHRPWLERFATAIASGGPGAYVNFLEDGSRLAEAYPGKTLERLRAAKRRYDPQNLFHLNLNVTPA